jgi:hypothetical protein
MARFGDRELAQSDLHHADVAVESPAMNRSPASLYGAARMPGGASKGDVAQTLLPGAGGLPMAGLSPEMSAHDAFAIDEDGVPFDFGEHDDDMAEDTGHDQMSDTDLLSRLEAEERNAIDFMSATVAQERADAMDYYFGRPFGNEEDNESSAISTDVFDVVETLLPAVLKPFVSTDDIMAFNALGPNDAQACIQESAYVNHVLMQKNDGFGLVRKWVWDGLAQKNGVVKYWWDTIEPSRIERYFNLTADVLAMIMQDPSVEIIEGNERPADFPQGFNPQPPMQGMPNQQGQMPPSPMVYDVTVRIKDEAKGWPHVANVPPEEFLISRDATDANPKKARFCEHRRLITISEVRQMGYDISDDIMAGDLADLTSTPEYMARHSDDTMLTMVGSGTGANREVLIREMYHRIDYDGDGTAELRCFVVIGNEILDNYEVEEAPFSGWTPYVIPHKYFGVCPADMAMDTQLQKSTLVRQVLNNAYGINNNRAAISRRVNYDDIMTNVVNGFVRIDADQIGNDIVPMSPQPIISDLLPAIQYLDAAKENRQGISRLNKGLDANSLNPVSATEVSAATDQSQEREQLIARTFAETGLKDLMVSLHGLIRRHGNAPETFEMTGQWVTVDPRQWKKRTDMSISVGLGTGNKQAKLAGYTLLGQDMQAMATMGLCTPVEFYNLGKAKLQAFGEKDVSKFIKDPTAPGFQPPPQQPPEAVQVEQIRAKGKSDEAQLDANIKSQQITQQANVQAADRAQVEADRQRDYASQQEVQRSNDQRDTYKMDLQFRFDTEQAEREIASKERIRAMELQAEIQKANISAAGVVGAAEVKAGVSDGKALLKQEAQGAGYDIKALVDGLTKVMSAPTVLETDPKTGQRTARKVLQ